MRVQAKKLYDAFDEHGLLMVASAMSFQVLTAVVPILLLVLGLLGFFGLTGVWSDQVQPEVARNVSPAALSVIDDTVNKVLQQKQVFWVTGGAALATWQLSGAVRAAMDALNRVYGASEDRPWPVRLRTSLGIAAADLVLLLAAAAVVVLTPLIDGDPAWWLSTLLTVARWAVAGVLTTVAVGLLVHQGPDNAQSVGWVSVGSGLVVLAWLAASGLFLLYLTTLASYGSLFGNLASFVVLTAWLYLSTLTFLVGIQLDAQLREAAS